MDRPALQQGLEGSALVSLVGLERQGDRLALDAGTAMQPGREAALAAAQRFGFRVPPLYPLLQYGALVKPDKRIEASIQKARLDRHTTGPYTCSTNGPRLMTFGGVR